MQHQTIPEALASWAKQTPDAAALHSPGRESATYSQLNAAVDRLAAELRARGLGREDGIALLLPEGPELTLALLAAMSVSIAIPLAWPNPASEYLPVLSHQRVRAVVVLAPMGPALREQINQHCPVIDFTSGDTGRIGDFHIDGPSRGPPCTKTEPAADDMALILHSSGTTGRPKLVPRLHRGVVSTCSIYVEVRGITSADRCLSLARAVHSQGITTLTSAIVTGASLICLPGHDLTALPQWLTTYRPTYLSTTPAVLRAAASDRGELWDALRQSPLRCVHCTAGPLPSGELCELESMLGVPILNSYGMSEAPVIAGERYVGYHHVTGAVGLPWCEVRIAGEGGQFVAQPDVGEIVVRRPRVFPGYLDDPDVNAAAFLPGGWFRTGDNGFLDKGGYLHVVGRLSEIINRGGAKIAPVEVDHALLSHPAVAAAAVFAVPDARLGEDLVAAVVLRPNVTASQRELRAWLLDRLSTHKVPRRIWMVDDLPRTRTGKVQRGELARRWSEESGRPETVGS